MSCLLTGGSVKIKPGVKPLWCSTIHIKPSAVFGLCCRALSISRRQCCGAEGEQRVVWSGVLQRSRDVCEFGGWAGVWMWGGIQRGSVSERHLQQHCAHTHLSLRRCYDGRYHPQEEVYHFLNIIDVDFMKHLLVCHTVPDYICRMAQAAKEESTEK